MPKKSKALSTRPASGGGLTVRPGYIKDTVRGAEKLSGSDVSWPFLKLSQATTPQVKQKKMELGVFFNSLSGKVYGEEVDVVVILANVGRKRWGDYDKQEGILCQSPDGVKALQPNGKDGKGKATADCASCVYAQWHEKKGKNTPPECGKESMYLVLVPGEDLPAFMALKSTSFPAAKKINTMLRGAGTDTFANVITLSVKNTDKAAVVEAAMKGYVSQKVYAQAEKIYEANVKTFARAAAKAQEAATDSGDM